jgi:ADP-heptose:LPS heptosyltransferase/GT2 family glycosyltransferase
MADLPPAPESEPIDLQTDLATDTVAEAAAAEPALQIPIVLIDIDPAVTCGFVHGRFDIQIRGRVASPVPIDEVELLADGEAVSRVQFGRPQHADATVLPDGTPAHQYTYQLSFPRPQERAAGACGCVIRAQASDGHIHEESFELMIDPGGTDPVTFTSGPLQPSSGYNNLRPMIVLYLERALLEGGDTLLIHGWVVSSTPVVTVQAFTEGEQRLPAAQLGGQRDDVAEVYPAYPNARTSGFSLLARVDPAETPGWQKIRVQAISLSGFSQEVLVPLERLARRAVPAPQLPAPPLPASEPEPAPEPAKDPRRDIHFFCDAAEYTSDGRLEVVGWAVSGVGIRGVGIEIDGNKIGDAEMGLPRPDVGDEYPASPMARLAGFRLEQRLTGIAEGEHDLRIVVSNGLDDVRDEVRKIHIGKPVALPPSAAEEPAPPPVAAPPTAEFRFELDSPQVVAGAAIEPITGRLTIEGWVLARSGVVGVEVLLDDQRLGEAHYGLARQDVGAAFPEWGNALRSGYAFHCPPRSLREGEHVVRIVVRAKNGEQLVHPFHIDVKKSEEENQKATLRERISRVESGVLADALDNLGYHPHFRLLLRQSGTLALDALGATLESLRTQAYRNWDLTILADAEETAAGVRQWLADSATELADRIVVVGPGDPAFETPIAGEPDDGPGLYSVLCPGDELGCDALAEIAVAGGLHRQADFLYADEIRISPATDEREPFFKPDFSPDLLLSTNYIGRPWYASATLLRRCGATPHSLLADGEYDLILRCTEQAQAVHHVAKLLAKRGPKLLDDHRLSRLALTRAASRRGFTAEMLDGCVSGTYRLKRTAPAAGKVSIIIPTCAAHGYIETCINTLRAKTAYSNYEIVCIDNIPASQTTWKVWLRQNADQIVDIPDAFNWSRFNNRAVDETEGEFLLFLNDDIEIEQADWLDALLEHAQRPEVGAVGPQLLYPDRKVQHAGMFLGAGVGRHAFRFAPEDEPGYFGLALTQRNVIAVTGACMLVRRSTYEALGRFDEAHSVINNDLDFCLRAHKAGLLTVFTPYSRLIHHELASRDRMQDVFDTTHFETHWKTLFAAGDPYFSPNLSRHLDDYRPDDEPMQTVFSGHPLFQAEEITRILVVKLDHIGDFVTALPAIRRLKSLFPHASITVLAGRISRAFASLEPSIDAFIEFDFFHARSQLGKRELTSEDFVALAARLAPYKFDLAVDLRKHLSTRDVLRYTGARFLAGYNYMGQFPFLDIALEWEGDKTLQRKQGHVVDDLLALVEAIGTACGTDRSLLPVAPQPLDLQLLPEPVRLLFDRPVVAVHPGAGNITKQWPVEYFSALIDLLIEDDDVNILLIGGPDEQETAEKLLQSVQWQDRLGSLAGQTSLTELPRVLAACALYIGNDSGPKHIAAALGVPTVGIHSGVVDAIEWGPMGRRAVALRRNMICSPCYLAKAEDCPRGLACLRQLEPALVHQTAEMLLARPVGPSAAQPRPQAGAAGTEAGGTPQGAPSAVRELQGPDLPHTEVAVAQLTAAAAILPAAVKDRPATRSDAEPAILSQIGSARSPARKAQHKPKKARLRNPGAF